MAKIILTDLDGTLIDKNTEREFLLFYLKDRKYRFRKFINVCFWLISKIQSVILSNKTNVKFLYYKIDTDYLDIVVKSWLNSFDASMLRINEEIIDNIGDDDYMFILTNSPSFISTPFCKKFLPCKIKGIFSTEIYIANNLYHFKIKRKMIANYKRIIAKKLIKRYDFLSFGYGDSQADIPFVSVCDEQFLGGYFS